MVRTNLDRAAHSRRYSDRVLFWLIILFFLVSAAALLTSRLMDLLGTGTWLYLWILINLSAVGISFVSRYFRNGFPTKTHLYVSRAASVWNIFILMTAPLLLLQKLADIAGFTSPPHPQGVLFSLFFSFVFCAYSIYEAYTIHTVRIEISTERLPKEMRRLRIAQLSDLHLGPFMSPAQLRRVLLTMEESKPDLLVITGDLVDGDIRKHVREIALFRKYAPPLGIYCVPGNHDYYENIDHAVSFMERAGMHVLRTKVAEIGGIVIVGADDQDHLFLLPDGQTHSQKLLDSLTSEQRKKFVLLLRHRPVVESGTEGKFQLQLSGHTHGGQVFPHPSSRHKIPGVHRGILSLKEGSLLYINNGAGFVGPPMRFLAPPEITIIDLIHP